jgi:hypothetical protein
MLWVVVVVEFLHQGWTGPGWECVVTRPGKEITTETKGKLILLLDAGVRGMEN